MEVRRMPEETAAFKESGRNREDLLAFWDFCLDLLESEYGRIPPSEEIDPRFAQGLIIRSGKAPD